MKTAENGIIDFEKELLIRQISQILRESSFAESYSVLHALTIHRGCPRFETDKEALE